MTVQDLSQQNRKDLEVFNARWVALCLQAMNTMPYHPDMEPLLYGTEHEDKIVVACMTYRAIKELFEVTDEDIYLQQHTDKGYVANKNDESKHYYLNPQFIAEELTNENLTTEDKIMCAPIVEQLRKKINLLRSSKSRGGLTSWFSSKKFGVRVLSRTSPHEQQIRRLQKLIEMLTPASSMGGYDSKGDTDKLLTKIITTNRAMQNERVTPSLNISQETSPESTQNPQQWLQWFEDGLKEYVSAGGFTPESTLTPEEQRDDIQIWAQILECLIAADNNPESKYSEVGKKTVKDFISTLKLASEDAPSLPDITYPPYDQLCDFIDNHDMNSAKKLLTRMGTAGEAMKARGIYRESIFNLSREEDPDYKSNPEKWLARLSQVLDTYAPIPAGTVFSTEYAASSCSSVKQQEAKNEKDLQPKGKNRSKKQKNQEN